MMNTKMTLEDRVTQLEQALQDDSRYILALYERMQYLETKMEAVTEYIDAVIHMLDILVGDDEDSPTVIQ